jgi:hypothetical protein
VPYAERKLGVLRRRRGDERAGSVTAAQLAAITAICVAVMKHYHCFGDGLNDALDHRLVGHDEQAIWTSAYTPDRALWGRLGRKVDPRGQRRDGKPILDLAALRARVREAL